MVSAKLICNPTAGRGHAGRQVDAVQAMLYRMGIDSEVALTKQRGDATTLAKQASANFALIIAMGGDGTLNEVVNGLVQEQAVEQPTTERTKLAIIPVGTGNDFVKMLAIPQDWRAACTRIANGTARSVDVGQVNGRIFLNNVGIGFDAQVGIEAQKIRWLRGQAVYVAALARNMLLSYRTPQVTVQLDENQYEQSITLLTIGNGRCSGGGFWLTPNAQVDDGFFDICLVRGLSKAQMLALVPSAMKGTHITAPPVRMSRARRIMVTSADPLPVHADGEILYTDAYHLEVTLLPAALDVLA